MKSGGARHAEGVILSGPGRLGERAGCKLAAVEQIQTTNPGSSTDLRSVGGAQKQTGETRWELEECRPATVPRI